MIKLDEQKISLMMKNLEISRDEAIQLLMDDIEDEIGEEGEQLTKKANAIPRKKETKKKDSLAGVKELKPRKKPEPKSGVVELMEVITSGIAERVQNVNKLGNQEIEFEFNGEKFKLKISKPRVKKND